MELQKKYLEEKIEIEFLWNRLVYSKYKDKVIINKEAIKQKLKKDLENPENFLDEFLLYEILFSPSSKSDFENDKVEIQKSIDEIGFENSAKIYSESDSAKLGVKLVGLIKIKYPRIYYQILEELILQSIHSQ